MTPTEFLATLELIHWSIVGLAAGLVVALAAAWVAIRRTRP